MGYKAEGKLEKIFDTEQKSGSFQAREFVIEVADGQYPQMVKFQLVQDKCALVDDYSEGDTIEVEFDLRGREWNGKYFTNLQAWRISRGGEGGGESSGGGGQSQGSRAPAAAPQAPAASAKTDFDDDIPF
ncbi:DUF3127 domain-containing protein [Granulosicoccus antarcticus]|uniref:DUF3127 domain-containing protein n=1 Tax=Granulosicoccus antarcticus IMCC3135 TaxID=1192854 RepID=A0A2Z2NVJ7_9GAMM|nr:DUF3127 domain-containing protein [Granulosicoccus antarcticus]ASJ75359.1 hypothetical protein IMCC3135_26520 [Granulosicoccus antarcticus IMCC3135]